MPKISIIIPIFNKADRLKKSIESVLNQTYKNYELILINDGSIDGSGSILLKYNKCDSRIIYIEQENKGVSYTRNLGIDVSKGEYISFLDADDEMENTFLEKMVSRIGDSNACYCGHYNVVSNRKKKSRMKFIEGDIFEKYIYNVCTPNTNSWLIKKTYLDKYNIRFSVDKNWGEDMEFFSKIMLFDKNIKSLKQYMTFYYQSESNCLSENNMNKISKDLHWMEEVKKFIEINETDSRRRGLLIKAIDSYRIPGAIIYRLISNLSIVEPQILKKTARELKSYLTSIEITNGIRSFKLLYLYYILKKKIQF